MEEKDEPNSLACNFDSLKIESESPEDVLSNEVLMKHMVPFKRKLSSRSKGGKIVKKKYGNLLKPATLKLPSLRKTFLKPATLKLEPLSNSKLEGEQLEAAKSASANNCSTQARIDADDTTIGELASYFDLFVHIPKKMSSMAEMMYI